MLRLAGGRISPAPDTQKQRQAEVLPQLAEAPEEPRSVPSPERQPQCGQPYLLCSQLGSPEELGTSGPQGDDPAGQTLLLSQRWGCRQLLGLHQAAGDAGRRSAGSGRDDHTQSMVPAAAHGATTGVHHEAHQEPAPDRGMGRWAPCSQLTHRAYMCCTCWALTLCARGWLLG